MDTSLVLTRFTSKPTMFLLGAIGIPHGTGCDVPAICAMRMDLLDRNGERTNADFRCAPPQASSNPNNSSNWLLSCCLLLVNRAAMRLLTSPALSTIDENLSANKLTSNFRISTQ